MLICLAVKEKKNYRHTISIKYLLFGIQNLPGVLEVLRSTSIIKDMLMVYQFGSVQDREAKRIIALGLAFVTAGSEGKKIQDQEATRLDVFIKRLMKMLPDITTVVGIMAMFRFVEFHGILDLNRFVFLEVQRSGLK